MKNVYKKISTGVLVVSASVAGTAYADGASDAVSKLADVAVNGAAIGGAVLVGLAAIAVFKLLRRAV
ncbi:hypothetical protein JCM14076_15950 [Methylosoma difficile]